VGANKLQRGEIVAIVGGLLLAGGLFLKWYETQGLGVVDGERGALSGWHVHTIIRWPLLAAALAPLVLAYIILRDHKLSWPRGELTAVVSIAAFGLIFYHGVVSRPGTSNSLVALRLGWFVALLGSLLMLGGSAVRSSATERKRKPPGTI